MNADIDWVFDRLPPSGARRGGDPASHVFAHDIASFVREVVQNANDQAIENPEIHFRFSELRGEALGAFQSAIRWPTLRAHVEGAGDTPGGRAIYEYLREVEQRNSLVVLRVEDRNTVGLTGDELSGDSHFRALCKDTLYSHKQGDGAGGSYGLGKSVLWTFSGLSTVLFNSVLSTEPNGCVSPRTIGRTELPSHHVSGQKADHWYGGSGWFGCVNKTKRGARAESVWGDDATTIAQELGLERGPYTGTSILIVGFREPAREDTCDLDALAQAMADATARNFWPAMSMPGRPLTVWVATPKGGRPLGDKDLATVRPFVECYRDRDASEPTLANPGDVVVREIPIDLPPRRNGPTVEPASVRLCVRLGDDRGDDPLLGHIAWFRRPGMVVRYRDRRSLALNVRPFHAVLATGEARDPQAPTAADREVERFLRAAEPPGHDDWQATAALRSEYHRGYAKALQTMHARVDAALRELVVAHPRAGTQGPDRLRRRFPIGKHGQKQKEPAAFRFSKLKAFQRRGCWHVSGTVEPIGEPTSWQCAITLAEIGEDGSVALRVPIERMELTPQTGGVQVIDGVAKLAPAAGTVAASFSGESIRLPRAPTGHGELRLEVTGSVEQ